MPRPRSSARPLSRSFFSSHSGEKGIPADLQSILDNGDPAIAEITKAVLVSRMAGQDVQDPDVMADCIRRGRADHASNLLDGVA